MGVCQSLQISPEGIVFDRTTASERDHDKLIEENLLQSMEEAKRTVKCLLLGTVLAYGCVPFHCIST